MENTLAVGEIMVTGATCGAFISSEAYTEMIRKDLINKERKIKRIASYLYKNDVDIEELKLIRKELKYLWDNFTEEETYDYD